MNLLLLRLRKSGCGERKRYRRFGNGLIGGENEGRIGGRRREQRKRRARRQRRERGDRGLKGLGLGVLAQDRNHLRCFGKTQSMFRAMSSSRVEGIARVVERRRERETHIRLQRGSNDEVER